MLLPFRERKTVCLAGVSLISFATPQALLFVAVGDKRGLALFIIGFSPNTVRLKPIGDPSDDVRLKPHSSPLSDLHLKVKAIDKIPLLLTLCRPFHGLGYCSVPTSGSRPTLYVVAR